MLSSLWFCNNPSTTPTRSFCRPVLTDFPFAGELRNRHFNADDGVRHRVDEVCRSIGDFPWVAAGRFVAIRQLLDEPAHPRTVVDHAQRPARMHDRVIPRRAPPCRALSWSHTRKAKCRCAHLERSRVRRPVAKNLSTPSWHARDGRAEFRTGQAPDRSRTGCGWHRARPRSSTTSVPNGCARIKSCNTSTRASAKWLGRYMHSSISVVTLTEVSRSPLPET